ncbi:MAG: hypothetical protein ACTSRL_16255 [Candidatus Helarchaeota archaeon]
MKIDFKKKWKHLYLPPTDRVVRVEVPEMQYLMVEGQGTQIPPKNSKIPMQLSIPLPIP